LERDLKSFLYRSDKPLLLAIVGETYSLRS